MARHRLLGFVMTWVVLGPCLPRAARAQDWFLDGSLDQSFSSTEPYRSPRGLTANMGAIALLGPFGAHVSFSAVTDGGPDLLQDCTGAPASCVPGMLSTSYRMKTVGLGVSYDFVNPTDVMLTLGLTGTKSWHTERLEHLGTGGRLENDLASSLGFSASAHLRLRPVLSGIRPEIGIHYDHAARGDCRADAACRSGRNAFGVSVGLGWVIRPPHER